jgi:hypothetical protein
MKPEFVFITLKQKHLCYNRRRGILPHEMCRSLFFSVKQQACFSSFLSNTTLSSLHQWLDKAYVLEWLVRSNARFKAVN